jgi:hypothetical protein
MADIEMDPAVKATTDAFRYLDGFAKAVAEMESGFRYLAGFAKAVAEMEALSGPLAIWHAAPLEALAAGWGAQASLARRNEKTSRLKAGDGLHRSRLYAERASALEDCARELREVVAGP